MVMSSECGKGEGPSIKRNGTKGCNNSRRKLREVNPKGETLEYQQKDDQGPGSEQEASRNEQERDRKTGDDAQVT